MALTKITYTDYVTVIGANNLNDIQDEIIANGENISKKQDYIIAFAVVSDAAGSDYKTAVLSPNSSFSSYSDGSYIAIKFVNGITVTNFTLVIDGSTWDISFDSTTLGLNRANIVILFRLTLHDLAFSLDPVSITIPQRLNGLENSVSDIQDEVTALEYETITDAEIEAL